MGATKEFGAFQRQGILIKRERGRSAYNLITGTEQIPTDRVYSLIWKWKGAERIRSFLWLAFLDRLPTNLMRQKWGGNNPYCVWCEGCVESTLHVLRECSFAKQIWRALVDPRKWTEFNQLAHKIRIGLKRT